MSHSAPGGFIVHCSGCGEKIELEGVPITYVSIYSPTYLRVYFSEWKLVEHTCRPVPDTDGLRPIERFVKHGALDDMGAQHQHGGRP